MYLELKNRVLKKKKKTLEKSEGQCGIWVGPWKIMRDLFNVKKGQGESPLWRHSLGKSQDGKTQGPFKNGKKASSENIAGDRAEKILNASWSPHTFTSDGEQHFVSFILLLLLYEFLPTRISVYCVCVAPVEVRRAPDLLGQELQETAVWVLEIEPHPLQEWPVLLTSMPSLRPHTVRFYEHSSTKDLWFRKVTLAVWKINNHSFPSQKRIRCTKRTPTMTLKHCILMGLLQQG